MAHQVTLSLSELLEAFSIHRALDATPDVTHAELDAADAALVAYFSGHGVELVLDRPAPPPSARERATVYEEVNGVWRGYTVEAHGEDADEPALRFVFWEGDDESSCIVDIWEVPAELVRRRLRPRAGFRYDVGYGSFTFAVDPVRVALEELDRHLAEQLI